MLCLISLLTYPLVNWCILRKYISRPLLLLQSLPFRHTGSEMFLKPSRPPMHASSASRRKYFSVLQVLASCVIEVKWFLLFPTITESSIKPDDKFSRKQYSIWRLKTISAQDCYNDISLVITPTEYAETV